MSKKEKDTELAAEAKAWANGEIDPKDWVDHPEAIPRHGASVAISIRIPRKMLVILKEFASRKRIGYQVLMKTWLDERILWEAEELRRQRVVVRLEQPTVFQEAATFTPPTGLRIREEDSSDALS